MKINYPLILNRLNFHFSFINFYFQHLHKINYKNYLKHSIIK